MISSETYLNLHSYQRWQQLFVSACHFPSATILQPHVIHQHSPARAFSKEYLSIISYHCINHINSIPWWVQSTIIPAAGILISPILPHSNARAHCIAPMSLNAAAFSATSHQHSCTIIFNFMLITYNGYIRSWAQFWRAPAARAHEFSVSFPIAKDINRTSGANPFSSRISCLTSAAITYISIISHNNLIHCAEQFIKAPAAPARTAAARDCNKVTSCLIPPRSDRRDILVARWYKLYLMDYII